MGIIDDIKARIDIVELIGESVNLRKTGRAYVGFCPFHPNTRTPAFTVYPDSQSFYCFGCHASGTAFDFVMRKEGLDFRETLERLAARTGVQLRERTDEERQQDQQRTRLLDLTAAAARYFNYLLASHKRGQPGRDYVEQRNINAETIEAFQLGYSMDEWSALLTYLTDRKGFTPQEVEAAGLAIHREQGGFYDRFRGRLIFPIRNVKGAVIGFGGRALGDAQPKYLNTPQTLLFDKSQTLYGIDLARDAIRSADAVVLVEGYIDVITAHQHGFRNVVAPLGTALTREHIALFKKLARRLYLCLDADAAGRKATLRGLHILQENAASDAAAHPVTTAQGLVRWESDIELRIIKLPEGRDPDDVIKADPTQWEALVEAAAPVMDFYIDAYTADLDMANAADQRTALERLLPLLAELGATQQRVYVTRLEPIVGMRAELILGLIAGQRPLAGRGPAKKSASQPAPQQPPVGAVSRPRQPSAGLTREEYLITLALRYPPVQPAIEEWLAQSLQEFPRIQAMLGSDIASLLERADHREIWRAWSAQMDSNAAAPDDEQLIEWIQQLDEAVRDQAARLVQADQPPAQEYRHRQEAEECARLIRVDQVNRRKWRLSQQNIDLEDSHDREHATEMIVELSRYLSQINTQKRSSAYNDLRTTIPRE